MSHLVFISYARDASRAHAEALHKALGGRTAFLDTEAIPPGERIPEAVVDALFNAKVVVIFAEPRYFTRWYCLLEFRIARTPFLRVAERPGATAQEREAALRGLVVAMPPHGVDPMLERFPPLVRARNWPDVGDIERIAELVEAELAANPPTLRERYAAVADADEMRAYLLAATHLPPPLKIGPVPFVPQTGLPKSIANEFVGRADDLWRIHDLLWTERGDPATAAGLTGAIEATGGFGKTRLALEYLYRFGPRHFKGGLFWINAESDAELQLYDVLQALNPQAPAIEVVRQGSGGVPGAVARAIRSRPQDVPTPLFIIDNVPEPQHDQTPKPLETWCPVLGEVPVLTTSRTRVALGAGGGVVALPIETLDPASAVALLTTDIPREALDDAEWKHIAEWVGHLPLALEVLNRLLHSGEMTGRDLLNLSRDERPSIAVDKAMETLRPVVAEGALRGVTEAFSVSYTLLTPEEQYAARLIAWMAPAPIPTFVIEAFGPEVFAPGVRAKLRTRSFVTEVRDRADTYSGAMYRVLGDTYFGAMHRVLGDFLRGQSEAAETEAQVVASILTRLMESAEGRGNEGSTLVRECAPLTSSVFSNWVIGSPIVNDDSGACAFANNAGAVLWRWGHVALAGDLFSSAASELGRRCGNEDPRTLLTLNNLGVTKCRRGDYVGAQELLRHVLEATRRVRGNEHPDTLSAMVNLASAHFELGDYLGAQQLQERVVQSRWELLGSEHLDTLNAMTNLANSKRSLGDLAGAMVLEEYVLEAKRRLFGDEHPDTLFSMGNLANTKGAQGDLAGAQELEESVLSVMRSKFGDEHPHTLQAIHNLAVTRRARGDLTGAQELQDRVTQARRRVLGAEHPDTLFSMQNLAVLRRLRGDLVGAQELQEQVVEAIRTRLTIEHPFRTTAAWHLLQCYAAAAQYDKAQRLVDTELHWLLNQDLVTLTDEQRQIQAELRKLAIQSDPVADGE